jgi:hypothetical protein
MNIIKTCSICSNEWNLTREKLPEEDKNLLVFCEGCEITVPYKSYFANGLFWPNEGNLNNFPLLVTHWIYSPEIPK